MMIRSTVMGIRYLGNFRKVINVQQQYSIKNDFAKCRRMFSTLNEQFEQAKNRLSQLQDDPGNEQKLKLYALYKQATVGPCNAPKPGMMDFVGKAKWDAWNSLGSLSQDEAKQQYVKLVSELAGSVATESSSSSSSPSSGTKYDGFEIIKENGVATLMLNRTQKKNSITSQMYQDIPKALDEIANDDDILVTVVTGKGDYFSSGNDLSNFTNIPPGLDVKSFSEQAGEVLRKYVAAFIDFPKPLVAAVNGPALGVSVTVLGLFDIVYATENATFHTPFTSLAQSPEGCSSYIFPKIMGTSQANEMIMFNRKITAFEAKERKLVTEVFKENVFQDEVKARVQEMAKLPKKSVIYSKKLVRDAERELLHKVNAAECERLVERWQSPELVEVLMKFFQRKSKAPSSQL